MKITGRILSAIYNSTKRGNPLSSLLKDSTEDGHQQGETKTILLKIPHPIALTGASPASIFVPHSLLFLYRKFRPKIKIKILAHKHTVRPEETWLSNVNNMANVFYYYSSLQLLLIANDINPKKIEKNMRHHAVD